MHDILTTCFDYLFPPHEEDIRVRKLTSTTVRALYMPSISDGVQVLTRYEDTNIRALIHEAKFRGNKKAFLLLNVLFTMYLDTRTSVPDVLIPIPLSSTRLRARGYNQVTEMLCAGSEHISGKVIQNVLRRSRDTRPQTELGREDRLQNVSDAFIVAEAEKITGKHVFLVDDVLTTGATLKTAKATLLPYAPASITCVAFAH